MSATVNPHIASEDAQYDATTLHIGLMHAQIRLSVWRQCCEMCDTPDKALAQAQKVLRWIEGED